MAIDTPARIAVLGAGPIGLEAALYARFLGYDVAVFEAGEVANCVRRWGHVRMFTPFGMNRSPLGLAAVGAHDESYQPPADDALLTGREWIDRYLLPLSQTDLLSDHIQTHTSVVAVGKEELLKTDLPGNAGHGNCADRGDWSFRLLVRNDAGEERLELADAVLDCSGVFNQSNFLGHGGIPSVGELEFQHLIDTRLPEILGKDRQHFAGKHTLLVGGGYSAATNAVALARLAREVRGTRVTWITRREGPAGAGGPIEVIANDRLPERAALARQANSLATAGLAGESPNRGSGVICGNNSSMMDGSVPPKTPDPFAESGVTYWPATVVERIVGKVLSAIDHEFTVELAGRHAGTYSFDRILVNTGFQPSRWLIEELQIHRCYATDGPMKLAAALLGSGVFGGNDSRTAASAGPPKTPDPLAAGRTTDCLDQTSCGAESLLNPEPNYYILGAKSYGRRSNFLLSVGLAQIREVFTIIGDRESLDLYANIKRPH